MKNKEIFSIARSGKEAANSPLTLDDSAKAFIRMDGLKNLFNHEDRNFNKESI